MLMQSTAGIIIFFVIIVAAIVISAKLKLNTGAVALAFAFIMGCILSDKSAALIAGVFPASFFCMIFICTYFYGFATENGTMEALSKKLLYKVRNHTWAMPILLLVISFLVSTMGASAEGTPVIMSPVCFALAAQMGWHPMIPLLACYAAYGCDLCP